MSIFTTQIVISAIAVISCMVLIIALMIPLSILLLRDLRKRYTDRTASAGTIPGTTIRSTGRRTRSQPTTTVEPAYSSYNLYLVYIAIPDLMLNLYFLSTYAAVISNRMIYHKDFENAFIISCSTANLYLNCVVSYEILILLRNCHQGIRIDPPSLLKVTLQAMAVYIFSITVYIIHYFIGRAATEAIHFFLGKFDYHDVNLIWSLFVTYLLPVAFFLYVWITIKCRGYMPSVTGRMKELVYYFFRIVIVFCVIWLPGMLFVVFGTAEQNEFWIQIGLIFCGIQPIVSTCMAMTKSDVRKSTMDLITLSYIRTTAQQSSSEENTRTESNNEIIDI